MPELGIIALTPAAWTGKDFYPGIAISASRAGAIGVLDLEYLDSLKDAQSALATLLDAGGKGVGIRCGIEQVEQFQPLLSSLADSNAAIKLLVLCVRDKAYDKKSLSSALPLIRKQKGLSIIGEAINLQEAKLLQAAGLDAVIAKGNESSGRVGEETSFVLLQRLRHELSVPVWVRGGVGVNSAAAILAAKCAGVVLDSQLLLTRESPLGNEQKEKLSNFDGTESELLNLGQEQFRAWSSPGDDTLKTLISLETAKGDTDHLRKSVRKFLCQLSLSEKSHFPSHLSLGQDVAFAYAYAQRYLTVAAVVQAIKNQSLENLRLAAQQETLAANSAFAVAHGIQLPVVQGAMTRVSDTAEFALAVAEGGGLPFLALALMRQNEIEPLLAQCSEKLGGLNWGVGMLGFVPPELRQEQLQAVLKVKPPCALIAGGRPDQAKELEALGIKTYLHVPSPVLLSSFVEMGARRFIFEGKECGGHVGPRSSFVLWECMIETLLQSIPAKADASEYNVVFAGGIHDELSSAMVAAMAAPLVERGIHVGILMGTAYLFTKEAVASGAIVPKFQEAALRCDETVLLETGPGHAIRCVNSPYKEVFDEKRKKLESEGLGKNELRQELELMNLGRLRVASKGLARGEAGSSLGSKLQKVSPEKQWTDGMYMIGQVAAMHHKTTSIKELHDSVTTSANSYLKALELQSMQPRIESVPKKQEEPIAIVGMSCIFPKANDLESYWQNIINKIDTIEEVPKEQWDASRLYSNDPLARDKVYSKWGGFLKDIPFNPSSYGIPPSSLASIDPMQLLILEVTRAAIHDAGYQNRAFPKDKTSIVLANAGHGPITAFYSLRSMLDWTLSDLDPAYRQELEKRLPEWTEDSFPGYLGNVVAGRVANRFDLGGINFCVDAACASSLAALYIGIRELRAGSSDMVLLAATDTHNQPGDYLSFSKTHALSPRGRCRTFDSTADGIVISEGIAVLVLKRLSDAERDGDRIYALVRGIGGSSDGRDLSLTAPRPAGQMVALTRAYEDAGFAPSTVELVEAHGTGTVAGDRAEVEALRNVFEKSGAKQRTCALGSVKTMIGHTKCAAGLASVIKIARSLYHRVLPPSIGVEVPSPACKFETSPFYLNSEARPWVHDTLKLGYPRRAGVSAFGFGGTNFHTVLEEYSGQKLDRQESALRNLPTEIFAFSGSSKAQIERSLETLEKNCRKAFELSHEPKGPVPAAETSSLFDLAYKHHLAHSAMPASAKDTQKRFLLSIVAASFEDLLKKIEQAKIALQDEKKSRFRDPRGVFFEDRANAEHAKTVFLFPGQGSQQLNMLRDLSLSFSCVRNTFENADRVLDKKWEESLSRYVYPTPAFSDAERQVQIDKLTDTHVAQPAIAAADMAAFRLLKSLGLKPDMCAGHSFGEYVALAAAGVMSEDELFKISEQRGSILKSANGKKSGSMAAVSANGEEVRRLISHLSDVTLANINSPRQCIISGEVNALAQASKVLDENKVKSKPIAVSAAFHSPLMEPALKQLSKALLDLHLQKPELTVYSNTLAKPYPSKPEQIASLLCEHLVKPVEFQQEIEKMYEAGARIFIECGPGTVLTGLVNDILEGKEHLSLSLERNGKNGITQLQHLLAQAYVAGLEPDFGKLYRHRVETLIPRTDLSTATRNKPVLSYLINGAHIKRYDGKIATPANRPTEHLLRAAANQSAEKNIVVPNVPTAPAGQEKSKTNPSQNVAAAPAQIRQNPAQAAAPAKLGPRNGREQVMLEFQQSLLQMTNNFLEAQERIMLAYLQQNTNAADSAAQEVPGRVVSELGALSNFAPPQPNAYLNATNFAPANESFAPERTSPVQSVALPQNAPVLAQPVISSTAKTLELDPASSQNANLLNAESLIAQLIDIVSERTGYPSEMLDPNLDLEADLGIDSIKRVEILNSFRKLLPEDVQVQLESGIEKLAGTKTLQGIMDWIRNDLAPQTTAVLSQEKNQKSELRSHGAVARALVRAKELPALSLSKPVLTGLYLISDSEDGLAEALAAKLKSADAGTLILRHRDRVNPEKFELPASRLEMDLCNEDNLRAFSRALGEKYGEISGLIHLLPLHKKYQELASGSAGLNSYAPVRSLFLLCKEILLPLSAKSPNAKLFAATNLGGSFGLDAGLDFNPVLAAVPGMIKTFAKEYNSSLSRCLDFAGSLKTAERAEAILLELGDANKELTEVAYNGAKRISPEAYQEALTCEGTAPLDLSSSSVVMVSGGARGITAELCIELGARHKPNFVILGRGARPLQQEDPEFRGLLSQKEIKAAIIERLRREAKPLNVPVIEGIYQKLMKDREIRNNLERIEATGARVHYYAVDVRDSFAFSELIDKLYDSFGKIDAVINGAGVIEDAYIKDKSLASFDRVFGTKVDAALTLASRLQMDTLKYLIFFSSVVGRTGNAGQIDYVAANEVMNKLAIQLNKQSKARVVSIGWGPWRGGMAQSELESVFARYGWSMIESGDGRASFYDELRFGLKADAEVLLVGQLKGADNAQGAKASSSARKNQGNGNGGNGSDTATKDSAAGSSNKGSSEYKKPPLAQAKGGNGNGSHEHDTVKARGARLNRAEVLLQEAAKMQLRLRLDPEFDLYLKDHTFDGTPVLPMAVASELIAETAQFAYPDKRLSCLKRMDIPSGIMFDTGARDLFLTLTELSSEAGTVNCEVALSTTKNSARKNFVARALLVDQAQGAAALDSRFPLQYREQSFADPEQPPSAEEVYLNWLFHGPLFQGIESINAMGRDGIQGDLHAVPIEECLKESGKERWIIDPLLLDSAMQLAGVWARNYMGITALPTGYSALHFLSRPEGSHFKAVVQIPQESQNGQLLCDLLIYDESGKLHMLMEDLGGVGSKALNRLASQPKELRSKK